MRKKILLVDGLGKCASFVRELSIELSSNYDVTLCTTGTRDVDAFEGIVDSEYVDVKIWSNFYNGKVVRSFGLLLMYFSIILNYRDFDRVIISWRVNLFLDLLLFVFFRGKVELVEHNVVDHGGEKPTFTQRILWNVFYRVILLSDYSLSRYSSYGMHNGVLLQHPLVDCDVEKDAFQFHGNRSFAFIGASRGNRGLEKLVLLFESLPDFHLHVFSTPSSHLRAKIDLIPNVSLHAGYLSRHMFQRVIKEDYTFILPYIESTQSGIFYSLLANRAVFISTDSGDTGSQMLNYGMSNLFFSLDDYQSIVSSYHSLSNSSLGEYEVLRSSIIRNHKLHLYKIFEL